MEDVFSEPQMHANNDDLRVMLEPMPSPSFQDQSIHGRKIPMLNHGGFHKWRYPKIDGFEWKIPLKWMIWETPISGNPHMTSICSCWSMFMYIRSTPWYDWPKQHPIHSNFSTAREKNAEESFNGGAHHFCTTAWARLSIDISYLIGLKVPRIQPGKLRTSHHEAFAIEQSQEFVVTTSFPSGVFAVFLVNFPLLAARATFYCSYPLITPNSSDCVVAFSGFTVHDLNWLDRRLFNAYWPFFLNQASPSWWQPYETHMCYSSIPLWNRYHIWSFRITI